MGALALAACGQGTGDGPGGGTDDPTLAWSDLSGRTFLSTDVTKDGADFALAKGSVVRLTFTDDGISASGGCNSMGGAAHLDGDVLVVDGPLAMTEMACDEPLMKQDTWLADLLAGRPTLALDGDSLAMTADAYVVSMLDDETVNPDQPLEGTKWGLTGLLFGSQDTGAVSSVPAGVTATLQLDAGRVSGSDGCNRFTGAYSVEGDTLTFTQLATTKMACMGPAEEVERSVLSVFDGPMTFGVDGDQLSLINGGQGLYYTAG